MPHTAQSLDSNGDNSSKLDQRNVRTSFVLFQSSLHSSTETPSPVKIFEMAVFETRPYKIHIGYTIFLLFVFAEYSKCRVAFDMLNMFNHSAKPIQRSHEYVVQSFVLVIDSMEIQAEF